MWPLEILKTNSVNIQRQLDIQIFIFGNIIKIDFLYSSPLIYNKTIRNRSAHNSVIMGRKESWVQ